MVKKLLTIIIVTYQVDQELLNCLTSIYKSKTKTSFEVIVVDNGNSRLKDKLNGYFPNVRYFKTDTNIGFGAGNNLGAKYARGEYLFFLNPDTKIIDGTIDELYELIATNKNIGIVAPLLLDKSSKPYKLQGTTELTPLKAILVLSFLNKLIPKRWIYKHYYLQDWNKEGLRKVDVCPGTAFMISAKLFKHISGFDERFFLYFEEFDLCKRVRRLGLNIYIDSKAKIIHKWGSSTGKFKDREKVFKHSRFVYFQKNFGLIKALFTEPILRINKFHFIVVALFLSSFFLRVYNLSQSMPFIGDQGWFYLSARDMLLTGKIPLVGITSSHTWLHQGPLWTYMLAIPLLLFKFNPISGAYLTALIGSLAAVLTYKFGSEMFSKKVGIIASVLYAVCPLIVFFDRMPFDPSPIPFFTLLYFYSLFKWVSGNTKYFPLIIFLLAILYNLELATFTLVCPIILLLIYGYFKKAIWFSNLFNKKTIILSIFALLIPMAPVIIYDFSHGFKQTIVFVGWIIYKPFSFLIKHQPGNFIQNFNSVLDFLLLNLKKIVFQASIELSIVIFGASVVTLFYLNLKRIKLQSVNFLLLFLLFFSILGIFANQTPSDAYLLITFPFLIFSLAVFFGFLLNYKILDYATLVFICTIVFTNLFFSYLITQRHEFQLRNKVADQIIKLADKKEYNLIGKGDGSQFTSFTMNYQYLLWYKGFPSSNKPEKLKIIITEDKNGITVGKLDSE